MSDRSDVYTSDESESQSEEEESTTSGDDDSQSEEDEIQDSNIADSRDGDEELASAAPSREVTVGESDDEEESEADSDENIVVRKRTSGKKKRPVVIDSDSEDDEAEFELESRALSPRTRMSITGIRPADLTDDSSEIDYSDDEAAAAKRENRKKLSNISEVYDSEGGASSIVEKSDDAITGDASIIGKSTESNVGGASIIGTAGDVSSSIDRSDTNVDSPGTAVSIHEDQHLNRLHTLKESLYPSPIVPARYSKNFASDIREKLSSTLFRTKEDEMDLDSSADSERISSSENYKTESRNGTSASADSDIIIIEKKDKPIVLSSEDDDYDSLNKENVSAIINLTETSRQPRASLKQPKISSALTKGPPGARKSIKTPRPKANQKYVSQDYYDKEMRKFEELKSELSNAEKLLAKISKTLPDGGRQLSLRIDRLRDDAAIKSRYIATLNIEDIAGASGARYPDDDKDSPSQKLQDIQKNRKAFFNKEAPNWDDLSAAVNQIQPTHTGKQGLATFNAQKLLTVDRLKDLHGSLENCPAENVLADDPKGLKVELMEHQKHALAWMAWREKQKPRGGILADDMGLGKTLTMISLVLACKNRSEKGEEDDDRENDESESDGDGDEKSGTKKWSSKGRRDFYHGGTLVVCPASLLRQWEDEVHSKVSRNRLTVCVHHGNNRETHPKHLRTYDMVVTTYQIVAREEKAGGALYGVRWKRIILDEAHCVRNHKALCSVAVCQLMCKRRWALTGTPIQNKEMDIYALLKFLRCSPFDDLGHWKKWIDKSAGGQQRLNTIMKSLMLRRTKVQLQDRGELQSLPSKKIEVIDVELDKDEMNVYQKIMIYSRSLFAQFLFQRVERNADLMFTAQSARPTYMQSKESNDAYYKMHKKFTKLHQGSKEVKSHEILVLLLRLRQICCHPGLIDSMLEDEETQNIDADSDESQPEIDLLEQLNKLAISNPNELSHNASGNDDDTSLRHEDQVLAKASARVLQRTNPVFNLDRPSSKMIKVLQTLKRIIAGGDKAIVVSQWTSVLDILRTHIEREGVPTLSLNGTIAVKSRQDIVTEFNKDSSSKRILLLSLTAGGVGLNLVGANHLLLFDLHWNPQLEAQAQDRIYRVGQKKDVIIYKFLCKETVEERIKALQDNKLAIAAGVLTGSDASAGSKLTMDDLRGLFGL